MVGRNHSSFVQCSYVLCLFNDCSCHSLVFDKISTFFAVADGFLGWVVSAGDCALNSQLHQSAALTPLTLRKLEQLAAASNSGRVVLLEGETCSGKTQLVVELSRLAQRHLVTINLTAETGENIYIYCRCWHLDQPKKGAYLPGQITLHTFYVIFLGC